MDYTQAIILGVVQSLTEFLPISSSGHLVLMQQFLEVQSGDMLAFNAALYFSTLLAILVYFYRDIWILLQALLRKLGRLPVNEKDIMCVYALFLGTIPSVLLGLFLESTMPAFSDNTLLVAVALFGAACFFIFAEWIYFKHPRRRSIGSRRGFQIGLFQIIALLSGVSRPGVTIAGGMILGLSRLEATRFSFLLAIPIILGKGTRIFFEPINHTNTLVWGPILVGTLMSFLVSLMVIHYFLKFISRHTLWPFIWYTILMSFFVGYLYLII